MGFWSKLFGVKAKEATQALEEAIVSLDPQAAGEAEIEEYREELKKISTFVVKAQKEYEKELLETKEWKNKIDESMMALEILESEHNKTENPTEKSEIEKAINALMSEVEEAHSEYERELQEDNEAKEYLDELLKREQEISQTLKEAQKVLTSVQRGYETQKIRTQRAKEREEALKNGGKKLGTASRILSKEIEKLKVEEGVSQRFTKLSQDTSVTQNNDRVKEALKRAKNGNKAEELSISSRLDALKSRVNS
jgi:chromosome segregation ATPase